MPPRSPAACRLAERLPYRLLEAGRAQARREELGAAIRGVRGSSASLGRSALLSSPHFWTTGAGATMIRLPAGGLNVARSALQQSEHLHTDSAGQSVRRRFWDPDPRPLTPRLVAIGRLSTVCGRLRPRPRRTPRPPRGQQHGRRRSIRGSKTSAAFCRLAFLTGEGPLLGYTSTQPGRQPSPLAGAQAARSQQHLHGSAHKERPPAPGRPTPRGRQGPACAGLDGPIRLGDKWKAARLLAIMPAQLCRSIKLTRTPAPPLEPLGPATAGP